MSPDCECHTLGNAWVMCKDHWRALNTELATEPRVISALLAMLHKHHGGAA